LFISYIIHIFLRVSHMAIIAINENADAKVNVKYFA